MNQLEPVEILRRYLKEEGFKPGVIEYTSRHRVVVDVSKEEVVQIPTGQPYFEVNGRLLFIDGLNVHITAPKYEYDQKNQQFMVLIDASFTLADPASCPSIKEFCREQ